MPRAQTRTAKGLTLMEDDMKHWVNYLSMLIVYTFANLNPNGPGSVKKCLEESVLYCISLVGGGEYLIMSQAEASLTDGHLGVGIKGSVPRDLSTPFPPPDLTFFNGPGF